MSSINTTLMTCYAYDTLLLPNYIVNDGFTEEGENNFLKSIEKYILHGGILPYRIFYIVLKFATCSPTVLVAVVSRIPQSDGHLPAGFLDCQL